MLSPLLRCAPYAAFAALTAAVAAAPAAAQDTGLFREVHRSVLGAAAPAPAPGVIRERIVDVDLPALDAAFGYADPNRTRILRDPHVLRLNFFPDLIYSAQVRHVQVSQGAPTWISYGSSDSDPVLLVQRRPDGIAVLLRGLPNLYMVGPSGVGRYHIVREHSGVF